MTGAGPRLFARPGGPLTAGPRADVAGTGALILDPTRAFRPVSTGFCAWGVVAPGGRLEFAPRCSALRRAPSDRAVTRSPPHAARRRPAGVPTRAVRTETGPKGAARSGGPLGRRRGRNPRKRQPGAPQCALTSAARARRARRGRSATPGAATRARTAPDGARPGRSRATRAGRKLRGRARALGGATETAANAVSCGVQLTSGGRAVTVPVAIVRSARPGSHSRAGLFNSRTVGNAGQAFSAPVATR